MIGGIRISNQILGKIEELRGGIDKLSACANTSHHYCDDSWYSCPKHEDGCANDEECEDCNCGADEANAKVTTIKAELNSKMDELVSMVSHLRGGKNR